MVPPGSSWHLTPGPLLPWPLRNAVPAQLVSNKRRAPAPWVCVSLQRLLALQALPEPRAELQVPHACARPYPYRCLVLGVHTLTMPQLNPAPVVGSRPVPQVASSGALLPACHHHGSVSARGAQHGAAGDVPWHCWAGAQWDVDSARSGSVPSLTSTPHSRQEPTCHGDPGRSPLNVGNNHFSHCPRMLGFLPAIGALPSLRPSLPPSRPPSSWAGTSRASGAVVGATPGFPGVPPPLTPGQAATGTGQPPPCHQTGSVREQRWLGHLPGDSDTGAVLRDAAGLVRGERVAGGSPMGLHPHKGPGQHGGSQHPPQCLR